MSDVNFINFSGCGQFNLSQKEGLINAHNYGFNSRGYTPHDIDDIYYDLHSDILLNPKGCGYWSWKPYIIRERLSEISTGEILIYSDAGVGMVQNPTPLFRNLDDRGMLCFTMKFTIGQYTKGDTFFYMNKNHDYEYMDERMVIGGFIIMRKNKKMMNFINKWLYWSFYKDIITDNPSVKLADPAGFISHRHDQSILSLLVYQNGIPTLPDMSQYHKHHSDHGEMFYYLHGDRK